MADQKAPDTLPADFFSQHQPDTLPANFSFPKSGKTGTLPEVTNQDLRGFGGKLAGSLPWVGGTIGALMAPEVAGGGWLLNTAIGMGSAGLGQAAGSVAEEGIKGIAKSGDRAKSPGELAKRVGTEAAVGALGEGSGRAIAAPFGFMLKKLAPKALYESALGVKTTMKPADRAALSATGLHGVPVSETGYAKLMDSVQTLSKEINAKVAKKSPDLGAVISPKVVTDRLDALIEHYTKQGYPEPDVSAIKQVRESFMKRHSYEAPFTKVRPGTDEAAGSMVPSGEGSSTVLKPLTLQEAQLEKQGTYRYNKEAYGKLSGAQVEAEKTLARTLRQQIMGLFPEINALNMQDKALIDLEEPLRKALGREANKSRLGIKSAIAGTAGLLGGALSGDPKTGAETGAGGAVLMMALSALEDPEVKSRLAIALAKAAKTRIAGVGQRLGKEAIPGAARAVGSLATSPRGKLTPPEDK